MVKGYDMTLGYDSTDARAWPWHVCESVAIESRHQARGMTPSSLVILIVMFQPPTPWSEG